MEIRLPKNKLFRIQEMLEQWLGKKNATGQKILALLGHLQHASRVVRFGRTLHLGCILLLQKSKNAFLYPAVPIRPSPVVNLYLSLEWLKYPARSHHCAKHTYHHPDRCLRIMGMWCSLWPSLAATEMAS